jgi:hypothetical protein
MFIKQLLITFVFFIALVSHCFAEAIGYECPAVDVTNNVFDASLIIKESRIAVEKGNERYPVVLGLYRPIAAGCERIQFAQYSVEGSVPTVDSLFFMKMQGRVNVFTIVSWAINNRGVGTYGKLYQVYAYQMAPNGQLLENKLIAENGLMTGVEGYDDGQQSTFPFKTAADVRKFMRGKSK